MGPIIISKALADQIDRVNGARASRAESEARVMAVWNSFNEQLCSAREGIFNSANAGNPPERKARISLQAMPPAAEVAAVLRETEAINQKRRAAKK